VTAQRGEKASAFRTVSGPWWGLAPHISHVFDWDNLAEAVQVMRAGEHIGKIALTIP